MYRGAVYEKKAYNYILKNIDANAILFGGMDNTTPDIVLSDGSRVEVKGLPAQCGQFTYSTKNLYSFSDEIISAYSHGTLTDTLCREWCQSYYTFNKQVQFFAVI